MDQSFRNPLVRLGIVITLLLTLGIGFAVPALAAPPAQAPVQPIAVTPEMLAGLVGLLASLIFAYVPGIRGMYDGLTAEWKAAVMGISLIVIAAGAFAVGCAGFLPELQVSCDRGGAVTFIYALVAALVANQSTYLLAVKPFKTAGDPLDALDVGAQVKYVPSLEYNSTRERGAVVVYVWNKDPNDASPGLVNLQVFNDSNGSESNDGRPAMEWKTSVRYDPTGMNPNTWHFADQG